MINSLDQLSLQNFTEDEKNLIKEILLSNPESLRDVQSIIYDRPVLTIDEFLSPQSLGMTAQTLFPTWKRALSSEVFGPHSQINEVIFAGATGCGKTTAALLSIMYNLYRVQCFKYPQLMFGVGVNTVLATLMISIDLQKAKLALLDPFINLLEASTLFKKVKFQDEFSDYGPTDPIPFCAKDVVYFPKNMIAYSGSTEGHTISMSTINAILDEAEFRRNADAAGAAMHLYLTIKERLENRFMDIPWRMLCMCSSAKSNEGVIPNYIQKIPPTSKTTKVYSYAVWEVRQFDVYDRGYFYVLKGNRIVPSRILSEDEKKKYESNEFQMPRNCKMIKVPEAHRESFERDVNRALKNTAGETSIDDLYIFSSYKPFDEYCPELCSELYLKSDITAEMSLIDQLPEEFFKVFDDKNKFLKRAPNEVRFVHIDLAEVTEASVCISHKELGDDDNILVVIDFALKITSPTRIDLDKVEDLLISLKDDYNVKFKIISADQFQSAHMLQTLTKKNIADEVRRLSVDRTLEPYYRVATQVNNNMVRIGHCPTLTEQAKAIKELNGKLNTRLRKDMLDAFTGSVYNAVSDVKSQPMYSFDYEGTRVVKSDAELKKKKETFEEIL